jgi:Tol biopolymer transport system component
MTRASWMDGDRLDYVSGGKLYIFDYDNTNQHLLVSASSNFEPAFSPDYRYVYEIAPTSSGQFELNQTSLLTAADR